MRRVSGVLLFMLLVFSSFPVFAEGEPVFTGNTTLYLKITEETEGYIGLEDSLTIKVNGSEFNKVVKTGSDLDSDNIISIVVPASGPKNISITKNTDVIVNHLITAEESALGYFMTVNFVAGLPSISEVPFELNRMYTLSLMGGKLSSDNPIDPTAKTHLVKFDQLEFDESKTEYFIDMPTTSNPEASETTYFSLEKLEGSGGFVSGIQAVTIVRMSTSGTSSNSSSVASYKSDTGYVRYDVMVKYLDSEGVTHEKMIYINAYHSYFEGLRIETSQVVGSWTHGDMQCYTFEGKYTIWKDVYVSTEYVVVSLSNTSYNVFKNLNKVDDDPRVIDLGDGKFKLMLDEYDTSSTFEIAGNRVSNDEAVTFKIHISKKVVSMGRVTFTGSNFEKAYVYYQPDNSFPMLNPKALVMLYYDVPNVEAGDMSRTHILIETRVIDFKSLEEHGIGYLNTSELAAFIGEIDVTNRTYGVPTMTTVFLIEGDVSLEEETFGGVKYGIGDGWNGVFGNYVE